MIQMTDTAKREIVKLVEAKHDPSCFVRIGVKGGGCSGMSYTVEIDNQIKEKDQVFGEGSARIVCDPKSMLYLHGIRIDYSTELVGGGFRFENPNASGSCGCGTSFSV
jgi:iron-sulfur cluster assembly protein